MGRTKGAKGKKNKQVPLSSESKKKVEQGLKEAKEDKLIPQEELVKEGLLPETRDNPELKKTVNELTKNFGHDVIHFASEEPERDRIPSGIEELDKMITGFPSGAFSVIWGNKGSTKTTVALGIIAQAQKLGKQCLYLDLETSFDNSWADKQGIDRSKLLIGHFDNAEEALDSVIKMSKEKVIDVIILDSVQSLSPEGEQETKKGEEKSTGDDTMALLARRLSQFFRMDAAGNYKGNVTFILIGQSRMDLGGYIKLEKLSGGKALAHWATIIVKAYRATKADAPFYKFKIGEKNKSIPIGFEICYRLEKKKISGTAPEESEVRAKFYNEFGFKKPTDKQIETLYKEWIEFEQEE
jgi:RecA/RadA recombinase